MARSASWKSFYIHSFFLLLKLSLTEAWEAAWKTHICSRSTGGPLTRQLCILRHMLVLVAPSQAQSQAPIMWLPSVKVGCLKECNGKIRNACGLFPVAVGAELEFNPSQVPSMWRRSFNITWKRRHLVFPFVNSYDSLASPTRLGDESGFPSWRGSLCDVWLAAFPEGSKLFMAEVCYLGWQDTIRAQ